jgi:hypothetical protein
MRLAVPLLLAIVTYPAHAGVPKLELIADGLDQISNFVALDDKLLVLERFTGQIRVIEDGRVLTVPFLDIADRLVEPVDGEQGLLGLAFPPDFSSDPRSYVTYVDRDGRLVLSRFRISERGAEASSEEILLAIEQDNPVHLCGHITFAADGWLYLCSGDGQSNEEIGDVSQDTSQLRGKIVRVDLAEGATEIVAYGLRNPWRFAVDLATGALFIPDVGRSHWEEVNFQPAATPAQNYGWPYAEGNSCAGQEKIEANARQGARLVTWAKGKCDHESLSWPIYEYGHDGENCAVIGGTIYRGVFVFGDMCSGKIWGLRNPRQPQIALLADTDLMPHAIGMDGDGELVIADGPNGALYRLFPDLDQQEWEDASQLVLDAALQSRRAGTSLAKEHLDSIVSSRPWQLASWIRTIVDTLAFWR